MNHLSADRFFSSLRGLSQEQGLPFLLIGGHAVNLFGCSRETHDIDLLIPREHLPKWKEIVLASGYSVFREESVFVQFSPERSPAAWPLDFMLVTQDTFGKLFSASVERDYNNVIFRVPAVEHLIALKLHVLKQNLSHRAIKDFTDIEGLVEHNGIDLNSSTMKSIFERYGTPSCIENFALPADSPSSNEAAADFDLPNSAFISKPPRLSFTHSVALSERTLDWAKDRPGFEGHRARTKVTVEFTM